MKRVVPLCLCAFVALLTAPYLIYAETSIAAGANHTILMKDGMVWTWGRNDYGQLGNGSKTDKYIPSQIDIGNVVSVKCGDSHTIALKSDKTVWSWGKNGSGQLGIGNSGTESTVPVQISKFKDNNYLITGIASGQYHSAALREDGTVWTWGYNYFGQLGNGTYSDKDIPYQTANISVWEVATIASGYNHILAILNDDDSTLFAWGYNSNGQLGIGNATTTKQPLPVNVRADSVTNFSNVKAVTAGKYHSLALKHDGTVWAWGDNSKGQLGDNTNTQRLYPTQVSGLDSVSAIAAGEYHVLAIRNGAVWAWGDNSKGQLGDGTTVQRKTPTPLSNLSNVIAIAAGGNHSLAVKEDGTVWAWGDNTYGQLGYKTSIAYSSVPIQVLVPGDLNADWKIDLNDVILSLRVCSNIPTIIYLSDVDGDGKIDQKETIYDLQIAAEIR